MESFLTLVMHTLLTHLENICLSIFSVRSILFFLILYFSFTLFFWVISLRVTSKGSIYVFSVSLFFLLVSLLFNFNNIVLKEVILSSDIIWSLAQWDLPYITFGIRIDSLSFFFILLVTVIGLCTNLYILHYFKGEGDLIRFFMLLNWFIVGMLILVLGSTFFTLFIGWEAIGLSSFFLINYWHNRYGTVKASYKAFCFNQFSDVCLLMFFVIMWQTTSLSLFTDWITYFKLVNSVNSKLFFATLCLVLGCGVKSAQFGLHIWLPDSMEAPVPASALIHSATLVSAGVYVLMRLQPIIELSISFTYIGYWGALTAAYGGVIAASQTDVKKILAYSTISHCGFLFVTLMFHNYLITVVYLYLHGLFKALTFFCVGSFIKAANTQDMRQMGQLHRILPIETVCLLVAAANLGGFPFTFGFLFKKLFLVGLLAAPFSVFIISCCLVGMLSSLVYVYRLTYYTCFDQANTKFFISKNLIQLQKDEYASNTWSTSTLAMRLSFLGMFILSLFFYILFWKYFINSDLGINFYNQYATLTSTEILIVETHYQRFYFFYYILFLHTIIILCIVEWRQSFTWQYKIQTYLYLFALGFGIHYLIFIENFL